MVSRAYICCYHTYRLHFSSRYPLFILFLLYTCIPHYLFILACLMSSSDADFPLYYDAFSWSYHRYSSISQNIFTEDDSADTVHEELPMAALVTPRNSCPITPSSITLSPDSKTPDFSAQKQKANKHELKGKNKLFRQIAVLMEEQKEDRRRIKELELKFQNLQEKFSSNSDSSDVKIDFKPLNCAKEMEDLKEKILDSNFQCHLVRFVSLKSFFKLLI